MSVLAPGRCVCGGGCPRCAGPGQRLETGLQVRMQAALGTDLSGVRVHTDAASAELARQRATNAFTIGQHIFFARGMYAPRSATGERLIAHELGHVAQQGLGRGSPRSYAAAERESDRAADAALSGARARITQPAAGLVQAQDAGSGVSLSSGQPQRRFLTGPEWQLHLDPEIEAEIRLQRYMRWWLGTTLGEGSPPTPAEPGTGVSQEADLPSSVFRPIRPELIPEPDVSAVMAPYGARSVPMGARDPDAALEVYRRNWTYVRLLPDLQSLAPSFLRPLIPSDWRRRIAGALTSTTIDAQLRHDYPTPLEISDQAWRNMTGATTSIFRGPAISF